MIEKTEWEIVDAPSPEQPQARPSLWQLMKTLLGPWWQWKIAGIAITAGLALVLFAALTGVIVLLISATALTVFGIGKVRQWLRGGHGSASP
jgi:uncharacterized YccA/Bax inhibitor family protein